MYNNSNNLYYRQDLNTKKLLYGNITKRYNTAMSSLRIQVLCFNGSDIAVTIFYRIKVPLTRMNDV